MAEENFGEKTEQPTPKKRKELRDKGEVAKSRELPSVAVLLSGLVALSFFGSYTYSHIQLIMKGAFSLPTMNDLSIAEFLIFAREVITDFILALCPLLAAIFITAILSNIMQVGFVLSGESIMPKLSKIDPIKGLGRFFSKQGFMELFKSLIKLIIVSGIAYLTVKGEMKTVAHLGEMELNAIFAYIFIVFFKIFIRCGMAMIFLAVMDYAFQKWEFEKRNKMTKQEVKDEFKRTEGDPLIKSRIKSIQMEMARKRMMQAVPEADVIITNPTHIAVALSYDSYSMNAPKLIAKGAGMIAKKIKDLAVEHDIPIVENRELARNLNSHVEIGQEIPPVLFQAVAEVLAYVYKIKSIHSHGAA
jgi:flagellar biosynthetic protein FlhB